jgi:glycosyltransferase involved in cell wall biosynthesis
LRAVLLADHDFAVRERTFLSRLEVALIDEGVRVVHALPEQTAADVAAPGLAPRVTYRERGWSLGRSRAAQGLRSRLQHLERDPGEGPADVVHAFGTEACPVAAELARRIGAALVVEVWSVALARRLAGMHLSRPDRPVVLLAPDPSIERVVKREVPEAATRLAPWGVHRPSSAPAAFAADRTPSMVLAGAGLDRPALAAALQGIAETAQSSRPFLVFADAVAVQRARLWPLIHSLGLHERVSLVPGVETNRDLVLHADALLLPEARGEHRSLVLDAMAAGMTVVASADPFVGYLMHQQTALLVAGPEASLWSAAVGGMLENEESSRRLGASARNYVAQHHRVGAYVAAVVDSYEWLVRRDAIAMAPPA